MDPCLFHITLKITGHVTTYQMLTSIHTDDLDAIGSDDLILDKFFTKAQVEYAKSVVMREVTGALLKDLKTLEFNYRPRGAFGIGISMKVTGQPTAIRRYREPKLETEVVCEKCTLHYTIYGVFGFCPDCAVHNSLQILNKNLELVQKLS